MRLAIGNYDTKLAFIRQLPGVIIADAHLSVIGPISYPHFIKTRNAMEAAVEALNATTVNEKNIELWVIECVSNTLLVVRDKRYSQEYFEQLEFNKDDMTIEDWKVRYPELYGFITMAPDREALVHMKKGINRQLDKLEENKLTFPAHEVALDLFFKEWIKKHDQ